MDITSRPHIIFTIILAGLALLLSACDPSSDSDRALDAVAEDYIVLALAAGKHDDQFVDAYYGPERFREAAKQDSRNIKALRGDASRLLRELRKTSVPMERELELRKSYLEKQLVAMVARLDAISGVQADFDREAHRLFDVIPPTRKLASFDPLRAEVDAMLPGDAPLPERVQAFRERFVIPEENLDAVFERAIRECRERTLSHLDLPKEENFRLEYVTDKPWSGYNWYQGDYFSLIQLNTSLPIELDRVVHLGCHEGYPGHHTYNALLEKELVENRGWLEFSIYPLFSPQSLVAEGSANYGVELAFPGDELPGFEQAELLPLSGIEDISAEDYQRYWKLRQLLEELAFAEIQVARSYLDGGMSRDEARQALIHYTLLSPERATQRVSFIETYRGYVINYTLGKDIVATWVEGRADDPDGRWQAFGKLLGSPLMPSDLR